MKNDIACIQKKIGVTPDGIVGPQTLRALKQALGIPLSTNATWPTQSEVRSGKSMFGAPGCEHELTALVPPYPLYFEGKQVHTIRVHRLIAPDVKNALSEVLAHYGQAEIHRLELDIYGGSYNYRSSTGSSALSMHAWGIALDFAPATNSYATRAPRATLSHPDCEPWWQIWESHGATSLGRSCGYDWMHLQFARL
ncbi:MAG: M15 family metallopeptidase [Akkermansia sp.]|nr:M15 family metallopeptidase [Akkermansia sp.]